MALLHYFSRAPNPSCLPATVPSLSRKELRETNAAVKSSHATSKIRGKYSDYTPEDRAKIGKYAAENGPARAVRHFSSVLGMKVPETTARRLKSEYLLKIKEVHVIGDENANPVVTSLPTKRQGRPLLLSQDLDQSVQTYISSLRDLGGVVSTSIVMAAATGIIAARNPGLLRENGGLIQLTKAWAKSLLKRMGYVKRKGSNAGKLSLSHFTELQEQFLADIKAEVLMKDIPQGLIFNWDQTAIELVPTGQWTMNRAGAKMIPIAHSDDKRQVTAVFAATMTGKYLPTQVIYKGKTERCHPMVKAPQGWDIWHSENHWSNQNTMKRYIEKIIIPFVTQTREALALDKTQPALAIFDCFRGQTTPAILSLLEKHNIVAVQVPANCTDKLQPIDVSINKPIKDGMKSKFQAWYAGEVQKQLEEVPLDKVKVDLAAAVVKANATNWMISVWNALEARPEVAINGFKRAGIYDAIVSVTED